MLRDAQADNGRLKADLRAATERADRAEARVKVLERVLEPFAKEEATWAESVSDRYRPGILEPNQRVAHAKAEFCIGNLRRAASALAGRALRPPRSAEVGGSDWQPIESAPRDGTIIGIAGGCAYWNSTLETWLSAMPGSDGRSIEWGVHYWKDLDPRSLPSPPIAPERSAP